ncbi:UDP-glucose,glycoprotein glucosyltransferase [Aureobasidium sp. EXF-3400]|nr:UDP-glucose,glycoprotein glucosyltransferase [Aureobasidium sp. EXF-12344]KAI4779067.1 UDP-glucose,glycoprotein glucosyltransferase [Aureobasidium sp. EXF-3400]
MVRYKHLAVNTALALGLQAICINAAPSVNVALKTSFNSAPYLDTYAKQFMIELIRGRETAADENATAYFPLLDRIAEGHFDHVSTDRDLYNLFKKTLQEEGHLAKAEDISSFEYALSIHAAAPRIEAHYQFYNTTVEPTLKNRLDLNCETWLHFNGQQYCDADLSSSSANSVDQERILNLPFDRIMGDKQSKTPAILYADIMSPSFRPFHKTISQSAKSGKTSYRLRYRPSLSTPGFPLAVSGYGIALDLKRTDYIVIDDRKADESDDTNNDASTAKLTDEDVADLKPLSSKELLRLDMKASSFIMESANPFDTLLKLTQDFPKHSAAMSTHEVSELFRKEHLANREIFLPSGYNVIWVNGLQVLARDFDAYAMLEHLRRERKLINSAGELGLSGKEAVQLLSHSSISEAASTQEPQRYDWRDELEGGKVIIWMNDIENDRRYAEWPTQVRALLQRTYPGQLPPVRKEIHNLILPIDFANYKDVEMVVESLQSFVQRKVPIRFGLVPKISGPASVEQAKAVYHLLDTYGLSVALGYLQKLSSSQGRKLAGPVQSVFESATKDRKLRKDRISATLQEVLKDVVIDARVSTARTYLARLGASGPTPPFFVNGIPLPMSDEWLQEMSQRVSTDLRTVQKAIFEEELNDESYVPEVFLARASARRNPWIIPEDENSIRQVNLASVSDLTEGAIGSISSLPANKDTVSSELVHLVVIADFDSDASQQMLSELVALRKEEYDQVEILLVHNSAKPLSTSSFAVELFKTMMLGPVVSLDALEALLSQDSTKIKVSDEDIVAAKAFWSSADRFLNDVGFNSSEQGILLAGRVVGPMPSFEQFDRNDFGTLLSYERMKRLMPAAAAIKGVNIVDKANTALSFSKLSNLIALSSKSDIPEGMFDSSPPARADVFSSWTGSHTLIERGDPESATIQIVAAIDPASETAQRWVPILRVLSELSGVRLRLYLNPKERLDELPVKRFYRHVLESKPRFDEQGSLEGTLAHFEGLPADALLTMAMDMPPAWLVAPKDSVHDLDNIKLSSTQGKDIEATYELESILIEGHSRDVTIGTAPRGAQLVLGTNKEHFADTIIMANLGYFQFKAKPGFYNLTLQKGRSEEIFKIDSAGTLGYSPQTGDETTEIALTSFQGATIFPRLSRRAGMEDEDVLESAKTTADHLTAKADKILAKVGLGSVKSSEVLSKAQKFGSGLLSGSSGSTTDISTLPHADINIFSVASGHLYERMLNIMMLSVTKHTSHTVKFWFIEQFLSPSFKAFLPIMAEEYNFRYEMVTYKWPHWLRGQKEKQREIWGYKILFLDVLFPLDLDKVIFVDADQIVRTDMYDLVTYDLQGAPYGFTPMCDSRTSMEGFRFWKQGYWKNFLRGLPYHISALYVVDLVRFRQMAAGDRLRQQYHQLSADPNSLSNLDQDLPNHMQHVLPIHSLPQEWLWCETWCSDETLGVARTIDLCNNPQTKEPKLERARRQVPEWTIYDDEIAALAQRKVGEGKSPIAGHAGGAGIQAEMQEQDAKKQKEENEKKEKGKAHDEL